MKLFLFVCLFAATSAADEEIPKKTPECEGIHVRGKFHKKELLARGINRPYQLALLKHSHEIFYSFNDGDDDEDTFKIAYIQKNHTGHKVLEDIKNGFALASDNEHHVVFIGGSDGIYKFQGDKKEKQVEKVLHDHNIWDMFYDKELYFITYPKQHLYKWNVHKEKSSPERVKEIHEKIYQFAIDKDNDRFITNDTGVFKIAAKSSVRKQMEGPKIYRAIEISNKGHAHFCGKDAIYVADKKKHVLEEIAGIKNIFGLVFDRDDNMIFSDPHEIVRLLPEDCPKPK